MTRPDAVINAEPAITGELQRWTLDESTQLRDLRSWLHRALLEHDLVSDDDAAQAVDDVVLVATELAANALHHAVPPTQVRLLCDHVRFVLDVTDHDPATLPQLVAASLTRERGRGLFIAQAIAQQVGWYQAGQVKHVWAAFPITGPRSRKVTATG